MGRTEKSQGLAPPAIRKDIRAKQARNIINKTIPALLSSNTRARKGSESSELIANPTLNIHAPSKANVEEAEGAQYIKRKGQGRRKIKTDTDIASGPGSNSKSKSKARRRQDSLDHDLDSLSIAPPTIPRKADRKIRIITTDTLTAAHILTYPSKYSNSEPKSSKKAPNVCILNMASPLRPGGGVLTGATSQEEYLCARTTLLPSLKESFYRLPELGGIWTPNVLVFRNHLPLGDAQGDLGPSERYWVDVVSAGMLRFPELEGAEEEEEAKRLGTKDRGVVEEKMRGVLRIVEMKGARRVVLGAWGCGAYGNPVVDVAQAWRKVLSGAVDAGGKKGKGDAVEMETWPELEEVVFAISNGKMAVDFARAFGGGVGVEAGPGDVANSEDSGDDKAVEELRAKIQEMESQLNKVWNADLKARMGVILGGLKAQLREKEGEAGDDGPVEDDERVDAVGARFTRESEAEGESDDGEDDDREWSEDESNVHGRTRIT